MEKGFYRLIYNSRNAIDGTDEEVTAEIAGIIRQSRRNNEANDITGALLYGGGCFAQVLEGSLAAIETIYEKISRDLRHTGLALLDLTPIECRMSELDSMMLLDVEEGGGDGLAIAAAGHGLDPSRLTGAMVLDVIRRVVVGDGMHAIPLTSSIWSDRSDGPHPSVEVP